MANPGITVAELRSALGRLLDAVEKDLGPVLSFDEDFYWNVPVGSAPDLSREPTFDVGSVVDDVESVRQYLADDDGETSIWHECEHLGGVLRAITRLDLPS